VIVFALAFALAISAPTRGLAPVAALPAVITAPVSPAAEYQVPKNDGWVTDRADILSSAEESALEARLEEWKKRTGHQIAVLTIPSLEGESLEQATLAVARSWGIGAGERNDGALLFVAQKDRKIRIEVGTGLEGALTDSISGRIIRDVIAPQFRSKSFGNGIRAGVEAMIGVVEGGVDSVPALQGKRKGAAVGAVGVLAFIMMMAILAIASRAQRGGGGRGSGGTGLGGMAGPLLTGMMLGRMGRGGGGGGGGGGFSGFGGGGFSGGGASGGW